MEALHRQVLPFLLRRMKEDVLKDLPPKIMQDFHCDLSPLQVRLYEDFAKSRAKRSLETEVTADDAPSGSSKSKDKVKVTSHVFQALQYLRKVCNHPALVVNPSHPQYDDVMTSLRSSGMALEDYEHSPKLVALKFVRHLLVLCLHYSNSICNNLPLLVGTCYTNAASTRHAQLLVRM